MSKLQNENNKFDTKTIISRYKHHKLTFISEPANNFPIEFCSHLQIIE